MKRKFHDYVTLLTSTDVDSSGIHGTPVRRSILVELSSSGIYASSPVVYINVHMQHTHFIFPYSKRIISKIISGLGVYTDAETGGAFSENDPNRNQI